MGGNAVFKHTIMLMILAIVVASLIAFGTPKQKAYADAKDNLAKSSVGILGGWSEVVIYPAQEAAKPGWLGKVLLPLNIGVGAVKGAVREGIGAVDFVTFFKGKNVVDSYPGEDL